MAQFAYNNAMHATTKKHHSLPITDTTLPLWENHLISNKLPTKQINCRNYSTLQVNFKDIRIVSTVLLLGWQFVAYLNVLP